MQKKKKQEVTRNLILELLLNTFDQHTDTQ